VFVGPACTKVLQSAFAQVSTMLADPSKASQIYVPVSLFLLFSLCFAPADPDSHSECSTCAKRRPTAPMSSMHCRALSWTRSRSDASPLPLLSSLTRCGLQYDNPDTGFPAEAMCTALLAQLDALSAFAQWVAPQLVRLASILKYVSLERG
jgi:hypothetical protein